MTAVFSLSLAAATLSATTSSSTVLQTFPSCEEGTINIRDYGVAGDGHTDVTEAFRRVLDEAADTECAIIIPRGVYLIEDLLFSENLALVFRGGRLYLPEGRQVRIYGSIEAGSRQIFSGEGLVTGKLDNRYVYPQWFGARGDGVNNDAPALQKAADLAAGSTGNTLFIPDGEYLFTVWRRDRPNSRFTGMCRGLTEAEPSNWKTEGR